ncbi:MAG: GNAT family N-acetyltransferase [Ignavibacteriales bacterium]|nr:GNAT family N-acetyltransferase [Ignavibacteriales bacterium]
MLNFEKILENTIVMLRPITQNDILEFKKITTNKNLWYYFTSDLSDENELYNWVYNAISDNKNKIRLAFTIIFKPENKIIGSTSFGNFSHNDSRIEIGWTWLARDFQGKGINDYIKYLMLKYCFEELNLKRVEFKTDVLNLFARNALKRIGAVEEGVLRSHTLMTNNRRRDTIYYSILENEWPNIKDCFLTKYNLK